MRSRSLHEWGRLIARTEMWYAAIFAFTVGSVIAAAFTIIFTPRKG